MKERLTRGTAPSTMCREARPSKRARYGAGAGGSAIKYRGTSLTRTPLRRTLQKPYTWGPMMILGEWVFLMSMVPHVPISAARRILHSFLQAEDCPVPSRTHPRPRPSDTQPLCRYPDLSVTRRPLLTLSAPQHVPHTPIRHDPPTLPQPSLPSEEGTPFTV